MKQTLTFLTVLLLVPLATPHAVEVTGGRVDSAPFVAGKEGYTCYRGPTRAVSAKGTVLAFCEGRVNSHKDEDDMDVVLKRSTDGGRTWGPLSNGDLMLNSRNQNDDENYRVVSVSRDGGATFTETWLETALVEPRGCQASLLFHSLNPASGKGNILFSNPVTAYNANETTTFDLSNHLQSSLDVVPEPTSLVL